MYLVQMKQLVHKSKLVGNLFTFVRWERSGYVATFALMICTLQVARIPNTATSTRSIQSEHRMKAQLPSGTHI